MKVIVSGRTIELRSLNPQLDRAFLDLYAAYFGGQALSWDDFVKAAKNFFTQYPTDADLHNEYFGNFTVIWNSHLSAGNSDEAERLWGMAFEPALTWEAENTPALLHKGSGYYFWSMTALRRGDLDKGYSLMHQAVVEDIRTTGQPVPDTPAYALASLNFGKADQAFRYWVIMQARFLDALQNEYSHVYGRPFDLEGFKNRFLRASTDTSTVFLFAYAVARIVRLGQAPSHALRSDFAGQLQLNILFDLTLVIDAALKAKDNKGKFIEHAVFLTNAAGAPLALQDLQAINADYNRDFDATLLAALQGNYRLPAGTSLSKPQADVAIAYGIRNHAAHDLAASPAIWQHFDEIVRVVMNALFATVDFLY